MGELLLSNLNYKSFVDFAADLLGPAAGFFVGWSYWFAWVVTGIADLVAITGYARFWWPGLPIWVPALVTVALILAVNLFSVRHFGELEFWFALIKVAAIVCLIAVGAILVATNFVSPHGVHATIENLWNDNGFFPTGFLGVVSGFQIAFSHTSVWSSLAPPRLRQRTRAAPFPARSMPCRCGSRCSTSVPCWRSWPSCRGGSSPVASPRL